MFRHEDQISRGPRRGVRQFGALAGLAVALLAIALLTSAFVAQGLESAQRARCAHNLMQIMLALENYSQRHGALPPAYTVDANGRRLHSWRALILDALDSSNAYNSIDFSKPWDDPVNAQAFAEPLSVFHCPNLTDLPVNRTVYRAIVGPRNFLLPTDPRPLATITDDRGTTLAVVEVAAEDAVHWMAPEDADEAMVLKLGGHAKLPHADGFIVSSADAGIHFLKATTNAELRQALISVDGGEIVDSNPYERSYDFRIRLDKRPRR
ncbi:DUF1559 family PulG-like putative transporter [Paludisphaera rhizosphaerae]|nr:DUF1559 domain-containing protein [Paludisphaera rhizosphaerae]